MTQEIPLINQLFPEDWMIKETSSGHKTECPDCGLQGGRTQGFILYPETNTWFCHSSGRHGGMLELVAMLNKVISCSDCNDTGERNKVLEGELFKETIDFLRDGYSKELYEKVCDFIKLKKPIRIPGNDRLVSDFANDLGKVFRNKNILFYRPDIKEIVEISRIKQPDGKEIDTGFEIIKPTRFVTLIEMFFKPWSEVYTKSGNKLNVKKSITTSTAGIVLVSPNFRNSLPVINRIFPVQIPVLYNNELTFPKPGYDKRFGSWLPYNAPKISKPEMSLIEAKKIFNKLYGGFCFQDKQDKTNSIAALLTPNLRGIFSKFNTRTPIMAYLANRERAGKDFDAGITGIVYEDAAIEQPPISDGERSGSSNDELRKKITSSMIQGLKRYHSSNNKGLINNAVFESVSTSATWSDRILGKNQTITIDNEMDFSFSGNIGIKLTPDLDNRTIKINLFLEEEDANSRKYDIPDLHGWVRENKELILSALYTLICNWITKGCPDGSVPFTSFPEWAKICGGVMESAGLGNPCNKPEKSFNISLDSETEDMKQIFELCYEKYPNKYLTKHDIKNVIIEEGEVFSYFDWDNKSDQIKFGKKLDKFAGRILSNIKFSIKDSSVRASRREYIFEKIKSNYKVDKVNVGNVGNVGNVSGTPENRSIKRNIGVVQTIPVLPTLPKVKSNREVQFYDAGECKSIKPNHTKEDILFWLKDNPGSTYQQIYHRFGVGSLKFKNELLKSKKIIKEEDKFFVEEK